MEVVSGGLDSVFYGDKVSSIAPHLARRRIEAEHRWVPTPETLDALCEDLNRRAGRPIVQRMGKQLVPC